MEKTVAKTGSILASDNRLDPGFHKAVMDPLLVPAEEQRNLLIKAKQGDREARDRLIVCNLKFVCSLARRYRGRGLPLSDLVQEGSIGLMKAIDRYDPGRKVKFTTYAAWWILCGIQRAIIRDSRTIRLSFHIVRTINRHMRGIQDTDAVMKLGQIGRVTTSLHTLEEEDRGRFLAVPNFDLEELVKAEAVKHLLSVLDDRERKVLVERFGLGGKEESSLRQIGDSLGISYERVRQIEEKALEKIRRGLRKESGLLYG